jgi:hypothetical protein
MIKKATLQGVVKLAVLVAYFIQLVFLQLFIRLEPTMFGLNISALTQSVINLVVRYIPVLVLLTTVFLIYTALYVSSISVRCVSLIFLMTCLLMQFCCSLLLLQASYTEILCGSFSTSWFCCQRCCLRLPL